LEQIVEKMLGYLMGGGPQAIIAILLVIVAVLVMERRRLLADITRKDEKIEKIIDDYYKGNLTLTDALTSLKIVLYEIRSKL
jgi:hypothetical protein